MVGFWIYSYQAVLQIDRTHRLGFIISRIITCIVLRLEQFDTRELSFYGSYMHSAHKNFANKDDINPSYFMVMETCIGIPVIKCAVLLNH